MGVRGTRKRAASDVLGAALEVRRAALHAVRGTGGVDGVLAALTGVIGYDHASLSRWDPLRRRHLTLVSSYPDRATSYTETRMHEDPAFTLIRHAPDGIRWWYDVPGRVRRASAGFRDVLEPLGVADGMSQSLVAADGRYVGVLNVSTTRGRCDEAPVRAVMALLGECLAVVADPLRRQPAAAEPAAAREAGSEICSVTLPPSPKAAPVPVSGEPPPGLAEADAPLTLLARRTAARRPLPATVVVPHRRELLELRVSRQGAALLVVCRSVARPAALSVREVQVLAELTRGRTNREIADRLFISARTVSTHIEHILAKLDVPNRAAAAGRAAGWGLEPAP